jgi:hypothetical protein
MLIAAIYHVPTLMSLAVIFLALGTSVVTSLLFPKSETEAPQ